MKADAINAMERLAHAGIAAANLVTVVGDHSYASKPLTRIETPDDAEPEALVVSTLTGLVDWYASESARLPDALDTMLVHVVDAQSVVVRGPLRGKKHQRIAYFEAVADDLTDDFLGMRHSQDEFMIGLLTRFLEADDDRAKVMKFVGTIADEKVKTSTDDGISQQVTVRSGVSGLIGVTLPNVVTLHPRRSFAEIGSVPEKLVLRIHEGSKVALYSADAGAWKVDTMSRIATWLREKLPAGTKIIS